MAAEQAEAAVKAALFDDLNAPEAMGALFTFIARGNAELDRRGTDVAAVERARQAFALIDGVLDVRPRVARLTLQAESATWTSLGSNGAGQIDVDCFRRTNGRSSNGAKLNCEPGSWHDASDSSPRPTGFGRCSRSAGLL